MNSAHPVGEISSTLARRKLDDVLAYVVLLGDDDEQFAPLRFGAHADDGAAKGNDRALYLHGGVVGVTGGGRLKERWAIREEARAPRHCKGQELAELFIVDFGVRPLVGRGI